VKQCFSDCEAKLTWGNVPNLDFASETLTSETLTSETLTSETLNGDLRMPVARLLGGVLNKLMDIRWDVTCIYCCFTHQPVKMT